MPDCLQICMPKSISQSMAPSLALWVWRPWVGRSGGLTSQLGSIGLLLVCLQICMPKSISQRGSIGCLLVCLLFCMSKSTSLSVAPSVACLWSPPPPLWNVVLGGGRVVDLSMWLHRLLACLLVFLHVKIYLSIGGSIGRSPSRARI